MTVKLRPLIKYKISYFFLLNSLFAWAVDYHVGPSQDYENIGDVSWETLQEGDRVYIHWRANPYKEKWVINRQGTASNPIKVIGVSNPQGEQPVIDGNNAVTRTSLNFWNQQRGIIKIGGSSVPADGLPSHIVIENLEIKSARPAYNYFDSNNNSQSYAKNAAAIYVEKAANLTIKNCTLHDSGNGLFIGAFDGQTTNILIDGNYIYNNGIENSVFEHNAYTAAIGITYKFNRFGPLRSGALGNNLKDRSAGLIVKYNWIESGNRQLDLVDAEDSQVVVNHPSYSTTHVYGNILIEPNGAGNSQMVHYGGDSGTTSDYRKGNLYFYNNTLISTRSGNTTLIRLSTNDEIAHVFNNIIYNTANGSNMALIDGAGTINFEHNSLKSGFRGCHCTPTGNINNNGGNLTGDDPGFEDFGNQSFQLINNSNLINKGKSIPNNLLPNYDVNNIYGKHQSSLPRLSDNSIDIGAFEFDENLSSDDFSILKKDIIIYPNPTADQLFISEKIDQLLLYNIQGQIVKQTAGERVINTSELAIGVYFAHLLKNGDRQIKKFVKK